MAKALSPSLAARFVAVIQQRSTLAAIVPAGSPLQSAADLAGRRVAGTAPEKATCSLLNMPEFFAEVAQLGIKPPVFMPVEGHAAASAALIRGDCDATVALVDQLPVLSRRYGVPLRAIPLRVEIYANGLVAGDGVPAEVVSAMTAAVAGTLDRQRDNPRRGVRELTGRYPCIDPAAAAESWVLGAPYTAVHPSQLDSARWDATLAFACAAHGFRSVPADAVHRRPTAPARALVGAR